MQQNVKDRMHCTINDKIKQYTATLYTAVY